MGKCLRDRINPNDELCDEEEIMGCIDPEACNFNRKATYQGHILCVYPPPFRQCALMQSADISTAESFISTTNQTITVFEDKIQELQTNLSTQQDNIQEVNTQVLDYCGNKPSSLLSENDIADASSELNVDLQSKEDVYQYRLRKAGTLQFSAEWHALLQAENFDSAKSSCAIYLIEYQETSTKSPDSQTR